MPLDVALRGSHRAPAASALPLVLSRVHWVRPELVAEVKYLTWTDDNLLRQVVYEGLREEAGGRRGSPAGAALTTLTASLNDQIGPTIGGGCRGLVTIVKNAAGYPTPCRRSCNISQRKHVCQSRAVITSRIAAFCLEHPPADQ